MRGMYWFYNDMGFLLFLTTVFGDLKFLSNIYIRIFSGIPMIIKIVRLYLSYFWTFYMSGYFLVLFSISFDEMYKSSYLTY